MAETYDGPMPDKISLKDMTAEVNRYVNEKLALARTRASSSPKLEEEVYKELGYALTAWAKIEKWANDLDKASPGHEGQIYQPDKANSQYKDLGIADLASYLAPVMMINNILIGTDKLGHFFQIGYDYYYKQILKGKSAAAAATEGDKTESGTFGILNTGVYSNADIAANRAGMQFYQDLAKNPALLFQIEKYISYKWNEASNENLYGGELAAMWVKNLNGLWQGYDWDEATKTKSRCSVLLKIVERQIGSFVSGHKEYDLTGIYTFGPTTTSGVDGRLKGSATNHVNPNDAVDRVDLEFEWTEGGATGKGKLTQVSMRHLSGRWGNLKSTHDGGSWDLFKD